MRWQQIWFGLYLFCLLSPTSWGQLICSQSPADKGEVFAGAPFRHLFIIENPGKNEIEILNARPGCGCLRPPELPRYLPPGKRFPIPVEINTLTQPEGPSTFTLTLKYREAGETKELRLEVKTHIRVQVRITPAAAAIYTDRAMSHAITLVDTRENPLRVLAADSSLPALQTRVENPQRDAFAFKQIIHIDIPASIPEGKHQAWITLTTTDSAYSELKVPLTVVKREKGNVKASPEKVVLSLHEGEASKLVRLNAPGGGKVEVEKIEMGTMLRCTWAAGPGDDATMRIRAVGKNIPRETKLSEVRVWVKGRPVPLIIPVAFDQEETNK